MADAKRQKTEVGPPGCLMMGTGEYTTGFVGGAARATTVQFPSHALALFRNPASMSPAHPQYRRGGIEVGQVDRGRRDRLPRPEAPRQARPPRHVRAAATEPQTSRALVSMLLR